METIKLFDQELIAKNELCTTNLQEPKTGKAKLRLYIKLTDSCNAECKFCANANSCDYGTIDLNKLEFVIRYLISLDRLHGISITGGEPLLNYNKLFQLLDLIYSIEPNMEVQISTNGINLLKLKEYPDVNKLESIHISRHHYDDETNYQIFKTRSVASSHDIATLQDSLEDKKIININTIVMKDYISNLEEIKRMLDHVGELGVYKNGFVSLMKCNPYAEQQFINFNDIFNNLDGSFFKGHHFYSKEYCECLDGIYLTKYNKLVEFYARMVKDCVCPYTTQLVYTTDNRLTAGFGKKLIYK
jgi:molybdenum cofactor biosynthesis enzyme MoaA